MRTGFARVFGELDRTLLGRVRWGLDILQTRGGRSGCIVLGLGRAAEAEGE